jgi:Mrp family chromosome partitioning ATPase/capsular polysaccharide biosynthesis protein
MVNINVWESVRRRPLLALAPVIVLLAAGIGWSLARSPVYTSTARLYVRVPASDPGALFSLTDAASGLASAYSRAADATAVVDPVARRLGLDPQQVADHTSATPVPDSPVVKISATADAGPEAMRLADATARSLQRYVGGLSRSSAAATKALADYDAATRSVARAQQRVDSARRARDRAGLESAQSSLAVARLRRDSARTTYTNLQQAVHPSLDVLRVASSASSDRMSRLGLFGFLGLLAGAALGCALATLASVLDTRISSGSEVAEALELPLLGQIPDPSRRLLKAGELVMFAEPTGPQAEGVRLLRTNLEFANAQLSARVLMFVSGLPSEGKSATAANLAVLLSRLGERVVLVDLDLRRPRLADYLHVRPQWGISSVVTGQAALDEALVAAELPSAGRTPDVSRPGPVATTATVDLLPAGPEPDHPGDLVRHPAIAELLDELRRRYDLVLVDTPAALAVGDAISLSPLADALVVVANPEVATRSSLRDLGRLLRGCPTPTLGVVATGEGRTSSYYYRD